MKYSYISKQRNALPGIAILLVYTYHTSIGSLLGPAKRVFDLFFCGVDLFVFLSGLGLYFSLINNGDITAFLTKRAQRILPYVSYKSFRLFRYLFL